MNNLEISRCDDRIKKRIKNVLEDDTKGPIDNFDCIVLPSPYNENTCYYAQETIDFVKFFQEVNEKISIALLNNEDVKVRSLHSFDFFMPIIWIAENTLLPIIVGIVSAYIFDKMKGRESEEANVDLSFVVERDNETKIIHYKGPAREFEEKFSQIDLNEM